MGSMLRQISQPQLELTRCAAGHIKLSAELIEKHARVFILRIKVCHHRVMKVTDEQIRDAISDVLTRRLPPATACPSEVARALTPHDWRDLMPQVRAVAFAMAKEGALDIRQGGRSVTHGSLQPGPIRLGRSVTDPLMQHSPADPFLD